MELLNKNRRGQGLPLNTIVIAILVIVVLLVIIVFFTTRISGTGEVLNDNDPTVCADTNPSFSITHENINDYGADGQCRDGEVRLPGLRSKQNGEATVCCGTLK